MVWQVRWKHLRERKKGLFINTTSIDALIGVPFNSMYHATKLALEGWSESMYFELRLFGVFQAMPCFDRILA